MRCTRCKADMPAGSRGVLRFTDDEMGEGAKFALCRLCSDSFTTWLQAGRKPVPAPEAPADGSARQGASQGGWALYVCDHCGDGKIQRHGQSLMCVECYPLAMRNIGASFGSIDGAIEYHRDSWRPNQWHGHRQTTRLVIGDNSGQWQEPRRTGCTCPRDWATGGWGHGPNCPHAPAIRIAPDGIDRVTRERGEQWETWTIDGVSMPGRITKRTGDESTLELKPTSAACLAAIYSGAIATPPAIPADHCPVHRVAGVMRPPAAIVCPVAGCGRVMGGI